MADADAATPFSPPATDAATLTAPLIYDSLIASDGFRQPPAEFIDELTLIDIAASADFHLQIIFSFSHFFVIFSAAFIFSWLSLIIRRQR